MKVRPQDSPFFILPPRACDKTYIEQYHSSVALYALLVLQSQMRKEFRVCLKETHCERQKATSSIKTTRTLNCLVRPLLKFAQFINKTDFLSTFSDLKVFKFIILERKFQVQALIGIFKECSCISTHSNFFKCLCYVYVLMCTNTHTKW